MDFRGVRLGDDGFEWLQAGMRWFGEVCKAEVSGYHALWGPGLKQAAQVARTGGPKLQGQVVPSCLFHVRLAGVGVNEG